MKSTDLLDVIGDVDSAYYEDMAQHFSGKEYSIRRFISRFGAAAAVIAVMTVTAVTFAGVIRDGIQTTQPANSGIQTALTDTQSSAGNSASSEKTETLRTDIYEVVQTTTTTVIYDPNVHNYYTSLTEAIKDIPGLGKSASFFNGKVRVNVKAVMCDGFYGRAIIQVDRIDPSVPDFWIDRNGYGNYESVWHPVIVLPKNECQSGVSTGIIEDYEADELYFVYDYSLPQNTKLSLGMIRFEDPRYPYLGNDPNNDQNPVYAEGFEDIDITVPFKPNVDVIHMQSDNDRELDLSAYQISYEKKGRNDSEDIIVVWKNGEEQKLTIGFQSGTHWDDENCRRHQMLHRTFLIGADASDAAANAEQINPDSVFSYLNVHEVASVRIGDVVYYPTA